MGRRKCWTKIRPAVWFYRRLVVDHGLDDLHRRKLSSTAVYVRIAILCPDGRVIGHGELYRFPARRLGGRLSRWHCERQRQVARLCLGDLGGPVGLVDRGQLPPAKVVQGRVPLHALHLDARLFPLPHLASDRRAQHLWLPFCEGSLYPDMYVCVTTPLQISTH